MRGFRGTLAAALVFGAFTATQLTAQTEDWHKQWYWGVQTGGQFFSQNGTQGGFSIGGHWLITGTRSGLLVGFDILKPGTQLTTVNTGAGAAEVQYSTGQRLEALLLAIPMQGEFQLYGGGGFAINRITDAEPINTTSAAQFNSAVQSIGERDTKAFLVLTAGAQLRFGKWALFGDYKYQPASNQFLITSAQHVLTGGLRFALTSANEDIETIR